MSAFKWFLFDTIGPFWSLIHTIPRLLWLLRVSLSVSANACCGDSGVCLFLGAGLGYGRYQEWRLWLV